MEVVTGRFHLLSLMGKGGDSSNRRRKKGKGEELEVEERGERRELCIGMREGERVSDSETGEGKENGNWIRRGIRRGSGDSRKMK